MKTSIKTITIVKLSNQISMVNISKASCIAFITFVDKILKIEKKRELNEIFKHWKKGNLSD